MLRHQNRNEHVPACSCQPGTCWETPAPSPCPLVGYITTISSGCGLAEQELGAASSAKPTQSGFGCKFISWVLDFPCAAAWLQAIPQHCFSGGRHP